MREAVCSNNANAATFISNLPVSRPWYTVSRMTISLPHLWVIGHAAAVAGGFVLLIHLVARNRSAILVSSLGGLVSCMALAAILLAIGKSFFGIYSVLAWMIAFLAGYAITAPVALLFRWKHKGLREIQGH